jgi:hypothetical protein
MGRSFYLTEWGTTKKVAAHLAQHGYSFFQSLDRRPIVTTIEIHFLIGEVNSEQKLQQYLGDIVPSKGKCNAERPPG